MHCLVLSSALKNCKIRAGQRRRAPSAYGYRIANHGPSPDSPKFCLTKAHAPGQPQACLALASHASSTQNTHVQRVRAFILTSSLLAWHSPPPPPPPTVVLPDQTPSTLRCTATRTTHLLPLARRPPFVLPPTSHVRIFDEPQKLWRIWIRPDSLQRRRARGRAELQATTSLCLQDPSRPDYRAHHKESRTGLLPMPETRDRKYPQFFLCWIRARDCGAGIFGGTFFGVSTLKFLGIRVRFFVFLIWAFFRAAFFHFLADLLKTNTRKA